MKRSMFKILVTAGKMVWHCMFHLSSIANLVMRNDSMFCYFFFLTDVLLYITIGRI